MATEVKPDAADSADVRINPQSVEAFAATLSGMAREELAKLFDADMMAAIAQAQKAVNRPAVPEPLSMRDMRGQNSPLAKMDVEQASDYMRVLIARSAGMMAVPQAKLDADGLITQALNPVTSASGAYLLPDVFVAEVERRAAEPAVVWPLINKMPSTGRTVTKPTITSYSNVNKSGSANVNSATTATEITETVPVYSELTWNLEDFDARYPIKLDLLEESPIDVMADLMETAADIFSIEREREPIIGTGHGQKRALGLLNASAGITTVATSGADAVDEILQFCANIPQRYRARATLLMEGATLFSVASVLAQNVRAAQYIVGMLPPMKESAYVTQGKIIGGDFSRYKVYYVRLFQVVTSVAAERKTREVVITETWTGQPTIADAFRIGTGVTYA